MPVPPHLHALLEDARAARSAEADLGPAVQAHRGHRQAWYGDVVGPLVVRDETLPRLAGERSAVGALEVVVAVSGGAGALEPAVLWATRDEPLRLTGLQVVMRESDAGDLAPNARRIVAAVDALVASGTLDEDVPVYVEPPPLRGPEPTASWLSALDELATVDHRLSLRAHDTDGTGPAELQLAACIAAALDRELRFRYAGAPHAVRHPGAGAEPPGFLNVLLATRAGLDGASPDDMSVVLQQADAEVLTEGTDPAGLVSARRWCTTFHTDDVAGSVRDLVDLGWLTEP